MTDQQHEKAIEEIWAMFRETDRRFKETEQRFKEISQQIKETDQLLNQQVKETDQRLDQRIKQTDQRLDQRIKETDQRLDQRFKETDQQFKEAAQQIKELGKQIGGLGNKFGGFTEGMAFPSMQKILTEKFKMRYIAPRFIAHHNGEMLELDVLAYSDGQVNEVYVVEVKSRLREMELEEVLSNLERFPRFFPEHKDKALYGIVAAVDINEPMKKKVLKAGLYLALIRDDTFCLEVPEGFKPKRFN